MTCCTVVSRPCLLIGTSPAQRWPAGWQQTAMTYTKGSFPISRLKSRGRFSYKNQMYFLVFVVPSATAGQTGEDAKAQVWNGAMNEESTFISVPFLFRSLQIFFRYLHVTRQNRLTACEIEKLIILLTFLTSGHFVSETSPRWVLDSALQSAASSTLPAEDEATKAERKGPNFFAVPRRYH